MNRTATPPNVGAFYAFWGSATDTTELPSRLRGTSSAVTAPIVVIDGEVDATREISFPWSRPPVPARLSPRAGSGVRRAVRRFLRSSAFWPVVFAATVVLGLAFVFVTRDVFVTWDGVQPLPTGGAR